MSSGVLGSEWDGHVLLAHGSESERVAGLSAWVRRGWENGEKIVATGSPAHGQPLLDALEANRLDPDQALGEGRVDFLPLPDLFSVDGARSVVDRALAEGFPAVRLAIASDEAMAVLNFEQHERAEQAVDEMCRTRRVSALCQVDVGTGTRPALSHAMRVHLTSVRHRGFRTAPADRGLQLHGELDAGNAGLLATILRTAAERAGPVLRVDVIGVDYVDAAAATAVLESTEHFRAAGGRVLLVEPQESVEESLRVLEIDSPDGMVLLGGHLEGTTT